MATVLQQSNDGVEEIVRQRAPAGLWSGLVQRLPHHPHTSANLWADLTERVHPPARATVGIWSHLGQRADFTRYQPRRRDDVVEESIIEGDASFTVLRSPTGAYLRLNDAERELWHAMDGSLTVAELAMLGFTKFKQLLPVAELVRNLQQGFLDDAPVSLYHGLQTRLQRQTAVGWGQRLVNALKSHTLSFNGIDGVVGALYRAGGWVFFTRLFLVLHAVISIAGLIAFGLATSQADQAAAYQILDAEGLTSSFLLLWGVLLVSFVLHETAHALAVKHYGRVVHRGGVMLYYGLPAAFVDTSDIWLAGRKARIVVSLAGPLSDLLVGGVAALLALSFPVVGAVAYKLAFACYVATLFNLNPLLELDGYFVLVDGLRLPNLRRRALQFVSGPFWTKLRARAPFTREERIFSLFGLLTATYTLLAIGLTFLFWQRQFIAVLGQLWSSGWGGRMLAFVIVGAVVAPLGIGLALAAWGVVHGVACWLARRGYAQRPAPVIVVMLTLVALLAALPFRFDPLAVTESAWLMRIIAPLLWAAALVALIAIRADYRGARLGRAIDSLLAANALTLVAVSGRAVAPLLESLWLGLEVGAFFLFMLAGFVALLDVDLQQSPQRELWLTAALLVAAFGVGGATIFEIQAVVAGASAPMIVVLATPVYFGMLALALLLPPLLGLLDSRLVWSWLLVWIGIAVQMVEYVLVLKARSEPRALAMSFEILAAGCWAAAWSAHYVVVRSLTPERLHWSADAAMSESQRLQRAFERSYAGCYTLLREVYGQRHAKALDDRIDVVAATANWDVTLDRDQARISPALAAQPLDVQGARYAEILHYTVASIEAIAGASFARRAIQSAYDALPWPEREAADRRCFSNASWARDLSRAFSNERAMRLRLLRQVDLFATFDDDELDALAAALQPLQVSGGRQLLASGQQPHGIWIVEAGEVIVWEGRRAFTELHRGEFFGAIELVSNTSAGDAWQDDVALHNEPSAHSYHTSVDSALLFLPLDEFLRIQHDASVHTADGIEILKVLRFLERVPLFADLPRQTLRDLARAASRRELAARQIIVRQGKPSGAFYMIERGQVAVVASRVDATGAARPQAVAQLGAGEYFGEIELLRRTPPVASIISITPATLLALPHATLSDALIGSADASQRLEQVGSGRLITLRASIGIAE